MEKIILFNRIALRFIKNISAYLGPVELHCENPSDAFNFGTIEKAEEWAKESGFCSLAILKSIK